MEISASSGQSRASKRQAAPFFALIAAAGSGTRFGGDIPKQYMELGGKPVLRYAIEALLACPDLRTLKIIIDPAHTALYHEAVRGLELPPPVNGGDSRKKSIYNGLLSFSNLKNDDIILIHDGARPFIGSNDLSTVAAEAAESGAASIATPVSDTLKYKNNRGNNGQAETYVDRDGLWALQTPQAFRYGLLRGAHEMATDDGKFTDDTGLVSAAGQDVALVPGTKTNLKITTADDMALARRLLGGESETRTGFGFDVHAFADGSGLVLCGIKIPYQKRLAGHSDADVGLHALTDAILGAMGGDDIGRHFPPSDPQWQGADSALFLRMATDMVRRQGGRIVNLDVTLICETPKIGPHRDEMRARIAEICAIAPGRVNVKATTTERLGFTGRGEGIAAQAVATINMPAEAAP